jgi:twinkle protein
MDPEQIDEAVRRLIESVFSQIGSREISSQPGAYSDEIVPIEDLEAGILDGRLTVDHGEDPGWRSLNRLYRPPRGLWTVVHGIPSHGKTTWADCLMVNLIKLSGWKFAVFSAENYPILRHARILLQRYIGLPWEEIDEAEIITAMHTLGRSITLFDPHENHLSLEHILDMALVTKKKRGLDGLIIDPWNELDHSGRRAGEMETEYISRSLSRIRRFAREQHIHIWVLAHPMKLQRGKDGKYPEPSLYDISGSAAWRAKCDFGILVWRDLEKPEEPTRVVVQKVRYSGVHGELGVSFLDYHKPTACYEDNLHKNGVL